MGRDRGTGQLRRVPPGTAAATPEPADAATGVVVQVRVDSPVPHLDRPFDYLVPADLVEATAVGSRVRVRFAGRLCDGWVVDLGASGEQFARLRPIERVVGPGPVLTSATLDLVTHVAARYAGTFADVVRAAVPPRHARAERAAAKPVDPAALVAPDPTPWSDYDHGPALLARLARPTGTPTRAVWSSAPASSWVDEVVALVRTVLARPAADALVVVPDAADVARLLAGLDVERSGGLVAVLTADAGPERRYREFARVLRGGPRVVVGTRAAVFAPLADLRLIVLWDDGDDALADPQAPYWDAREVAAVRAHRSGCDLVVGSPARSVVTQHWCATGWARSIQPDRAVVARRAPRVRALAAEDAARDAAAAAARIPHTAWQAARAGLVDGPVLVQVARRGYVPALACQRCRSAARCPSCAGPLALAAGGSTPACGRCGHVVGAWACPECGGRRLRAIDVGAERTVEEIGRAFPGVPVVASHAGHVVAEISATAQVVVATPGAEPDCPGGYRAVLLLDARSQLTRVGLGATEDVARRWFAASRLAAPRARIVVTAANAIPVVQALVRWDAPWLAERELDDRAGAGLPPVTRVAVLRGARADLLDVAAALTVPHRLLGPVPTGEDGDRHRAVVVVDRTDATALAAALRAISATRSAHAGTAKVAVHLDPRDL